MATLKTCFFILNIILYFSVADKPLCELTPMADNEKAFVWSAMDWSDGEEVAEKFAARF